MPPRLNKNQSSNSNHHHQVSNSSSTSQKAKIAHHQHLLHHPSSSHNPSWTPSRSSSSSNQIAIRHATEQFAQAVHLVEGFADTLDAIPPSITRSLSDLKELDAVLSDPLNKLHSSLDKLLLSISQPDSMRSEQRLEMLRSIVADIEKYKIGGEDKIRVANGTGESLSRHIRQLDTTTSLLISSLPPSLEHRLPVSTFPTGYPQLTGSLRAKPIGGVWNDPGGPDSQQASISPPSVPVREFVNFEHDSPARRADQAPRLFDAQPLPKRPRITQSVSSSQLGLPSALPDESTRRGHSEAGGVLLDQHMLMLAQPGLKRRAAAAREESLAEPKPGGPARAPKAAASISLAPPIREEPSLRQPTPPSGTLNGPVGKNKRARVSSAAMAETETDEPPSPRPKPVPTTQARPQPGLPAPKKRVRKSNQSVPAGKHTDDSLQQVGTEPPAGTNTPDQPLPATAPSLSASGPPQLPKQPSVPLSQASGSAKKTTSGRQANGIAKGSEESAVLAGPPAKRSYTKRNGPVNGTSTTAQAKGKRAGVKKTGGPMAEPGGLGSADGLAPKAEGERARKSASKETVRLEDVLEGARGRQRKTTGSGSEARREKETRKYGSDGEYTAWGPGSAHGEEFERETEPEDVLEDQDRVGVHSQMGVATGSGDEAEYGDCLENQSQGSNQTSSTKAYCICKGEVFGERMVACDNAECPIEWFHYQCAGLTEDPTGSWFCAACEANGFGSTDGPTHKRPGPGEEKAKAPGDEDSRRAETGEKDDVGERRTDRMPGSHVGAAEAPVGATVKVENGQTVRPDP